MCAVDGRAVGPAFATRVQPSQGHGSEVGDPARYFRRRLAARDHPEGYLDCGLVHGAPGVLALLAIALPDELLRLPPELAQVDALLNDERFFAPFRPTST